MPREPVQVHADPVRLAQALSNLLNNAAKYTPNGGRIQLQVACEAGSAVIRVRDNGIGIAEEALPRVFELFMQEADSAGRAQGGLGIGLTLVRTFVSAPWRRGRSVQRRSRQGQRVRHPPARAGCKRVAARCRR